MGGGERGSISVKGEFRLRYVVACERRDQGTRKEGPISELQIIRVKGRKKATAKGGVNYQSAKTGSIPREEGTPEGDSSEKKKWVELDFSSTCKKNGK